MGQPYYHFPRQLKYLSPFIHQALEVEEHAVELDLEAEKGTLQPEPEPEQSSESQHPSASITQDQDSASLLPSPDPLTDSAAELKDALNILNIQDNIPNRQDIITPRLFSLFSLKLFSCFSVSHYSGVSENVICIA